MKKILALLLALTMVFAVVAGCAADPMPTPPAVPAAPAEPGAPAAPAAPAEEPSLENLRIGLTVIDLSNVFFVAMSEGVREICEELGFEFLLNDGRSDVALQIAAIENWIVMGIDVLIVAPVDGDALESVLQQARDAGIVIINSNPAVPIRDAFIGIAEFEYGYTAGRIAADWVNANIVGQATVGILNRPVSEPLIQRYQGFIAGVTENSDSEIVAVQAANTAELGMQAAETILQAHPDITGFICQNDTAALGVYEALMAAGRSPENTFVVGVDGLQRAFERISEGGKFIGTVSSDPHGTGRLLVETALRVIRYGPIEETIHPTLVPVTIENVADFLD